MAQSPALRKLLLGYVHTGIIQFDAPRIGETRVWDIPSRLSRLLLMLSDRADGGTIALTHDALAEMLGVRRSGVTTALHILEGEKIIRCVRGRITVRDRASLISAAHGGYGEPEAAYARLIGAA